MAEKHEIMRVYINQNQADYSEYVKRLNQQDANHHSRDALAPCNLRNQKQQAEIIHQLKTQTIIAQRDAAIARDAQDIFIHHLGFITK